MQKRIKASRIAETSVSASKSVRSRPKELEEMEWLLNVWIEDQTKKQPGSRFLTIKEKALSIYEDPKKKAKNPADVTSFSASSGCFAGFKDHYAFHNTKLCGEAASADEERVMTFPPIVKKLIEEEGSNLDQIFSLFEAGLYWKKMPSKTYISKTEAQAPGFKVAKDRMTVLLGANASGDLKLKPVEVCHSANQRAFKGYLKLTLGVYCRSNKRVWMTGQFFSDLIVDVFENVFRNYYKFTDDTKISGAVNNEVDSCIVDCRTSF
ncbi:tigger transposable element-derived protein 1-like [Rhincodon typus]|uniref:tigger transposable element-derived protein 1-like n=1 Tax=Rhincodon typus TaxID=259920 RepID=UPI0020304C86|nr:tigger transposable element-derived protein 1-like [Rhincodon typus]